MINLPVTYKPLVDDICQQNIHGATWNEVEHFYPGDRIRQIERASIRAFMEKHRELLRGDVLDFGSGAQPYRDLVSGDYTPHEKGDALPTRSYDAIMCNQVLQSVDYPLRALLDMRSLLRPGGKILLTYECCWDFIEEVSKWRFTPSGMSDLLRQAKLSAGEHELRAVVQLKNFRFPLGYGAVCTRI